MAKNRSPADSAPPEVPSATPRDLHSTSDIRFVMVEVGKMTEAITEMKKTIEKQGEKVAKFERYVIIASTTVAVLTIVIGILGALASFILDGKLAQVLALLNKAPSP